MSFIHQKRIKLKFKQIALILLGLYIVVGSMLYFLQEKFLFRPTVLAQDHVYQFDSEFEEHFLETEDKASINTLHFKAKNPKGAILYFHGNSGDLQRWGNVVSYFLNMNYDVYVMDYRTYGKSTGKLSEQALFDDAEMCFNHLNQFWENDKIVIYGRSLGASMATKIASIHNVKQLILEAPFYSVEDVARHRFPFFPVKKLMRYELPNYINIQNIKCRITVFHGTEDKIVPFESGKKLFEISPKGNSKFVVVEGGGHNDLVNFEAYSNAIKELLE